MENIVRLFPYRFALALLLTSLCLTSCATLPDATVRYKLAHTDVKVKVVRTIVCNAADDLIQAYATTPIVTHRASTSECNDCRIPLRSLRGLFTDTDLKIELEEDGRLKSINASSTGQAEAALKSFVTFATSAKGMVASSNQTASTAACAEIRRMMGDKPLTLTYEGNVEIASPSTEPQQTGATPTEGADGPSNAVRSTPGGPRLISADATSAVIASKQQFLGVIGAVCAEAVAAPNHGQSATPKYLPISDVKDTHFALKLRHPGSAQIRVTAGGNAQCESGDLEIWNGAVPVAHIGSMYSIPVPSPSSFGKRTLAATFNGSGALTSLQYATTSGVAQSLNTLNALVLGTAEPTSKELADAAKAEADLIFQQQRLAQCVADPKSCK